MDPVAELFVQDQQRKLRDICKRMGMALEQLSDEDVNWRPNEQSNSVANLVVHVCGNLTQRFGTNLSGRPDTRDRAAEFSLEVWRSVAELKAMVDRVFPECEALLGEVTASILLETVQVRDQQFTYLHLIQQTTAHASEHLGQILYISKMRLGGAWKTVWQ